MLLHLYNLSVSIKLGNLWKKLMVTNSHYFERHLFLVHIGIASMRQFQCVPITVVTEIIRTFICNQLNQIGPTNSFVFASLNMSSFKSLLKYLSLHGKLCIFMAGIYHQSWFQELLSRCLPGSKSHFHTTRPNIALSPSVIEHLESHKAVLLLQSD